MRFARKTVAWFKAVIKAFQESHSSLHAAGLTYFTILSLIPILCVVLVGAKVVHVDRFARNQINLQIDRLMADVEKGQTFHAADKEASSAPVSEAERKRQIAAEEFARQARVFSDKLFTKIDAFNISKLGWFGLGMLLVTIVMSLSHVEDSLNEIWNIPKARPLWQKAYLYLFVVICVPTLTALALSLPILNIVKNIIISTMGATWLTKWVSDGLVWFLDHWAFRAFVSFGFASLAFGYFLWVMPNYRVRFRYAWQGGFLTAVLLALAMKVCALAQVGVAKSSALYGSFAFLPIVMAWFYLSWQVVLLGASMVRGFEVVAAQDCGDSK